MYIYTYIHILKCFKEKRRDTGGKNYTSPSCRILIIATTLTDLSYPISLPHLSANTPTHLSHLISLPSPQKLQLAPETVQFTFNKSGFYRTLKERAAKYFKEEANSYTKAPLVHQAVGVMTVLGMAVCVYYGFYLGSFVCWIGNQPPLFFFVN